MIMDVTARSEEDLVDANPQVGSVSLKAVQGVHADALLTRTPHNTWQMSEVAAKAQRWSERIQWVPVRRAE